MDFMNRGVRPNQQNSPAANDVGTTNHNAPKSSSGKFKKIKNTKWINVISIALLFSVTVVLVAVVLQIILSDANKEDEYVDSSKMQAVFLNNGQVYFGKINELNPNYLNLSNIYYLRVNQQVQPDQKANTGQNDVSLVKLGCELHGPADHMVINREQVTFWENLKDDGQVAKAVAEYVKQNPNGQNCEQQNAQQTPAAGGAGAANGASAEAANNNAGNNTPATTNPEAEDN